MKQIRKRLTYANVMSSLAVFMVLGGASAVAASKIGTKELKAGAVRTGKLARGAVTVGKLAKNAVTRAKIANRAVATAKIANNAVTGAKVKEASLGTVPTARNLVAGTAGDAKNLVLAYATVAGASQDVLDFGGKGVASVSNTGGAFRTVTFNGRFPGVDSINDITMLVNTTDSDFFTTCSGNNDGQAAASQTEIKVEIFCFSTETTTPRTDPAAIVIMGG